MVLESQLVVTPPSPVIMLEGMKPLILIHGAHPYSSFERYQRSIQQLALQ